MIGLNQFNSELVGYEQFMTDIALIEKLKLSMNHHFYSSNTHFEDSDLLCCKDRKFGKKKKINV